MSSTLFFFFFFKQLLHFPLGNSFPLSGVGLQCCTPITVLYPKLSTGLSLWPTLEPSYHPFPSKQKLAQEWTCDFSKADYMASLGLMYRCKNRKGVFSWIWKEENLGLLVACPASVEESFGNRREWSQLQREAGRRNEESSHSQSSQKQNILLQFPVIWASNVPLMLKWFELGFWTYNRKYSKWYMPGQQLVNFIKYCRVQEMWFWERNANCTCNSHAWPPEHCFRMGGK